MDWWNAGDYYIAREILQRGVAACFLIAFISAFNQFPALLGEHGLLPVARFVGRIRFRDSPSLFHWRYSDRMLRVCAFAGAIGAAALVAGLPQRGPVWLPLLLFLMLWALDLSIVNVGQTFYAFGWESLLLEAGFVVAFLGSNEVAPPVVVMIFLRWLVFRLEFGAGMIKMRGGPEWRNLSALYFHHETQPMPNQLSWYVHHLPKWFHRGEVLGNHFAQLIVPFFLFAPQPVASVAAAVMILTQLWLVFTGNFAWLNWITIVLACSAIDDRTLRVIFPGLSGLPAQPPASVSPPWFVILVAVVTAGLVVLSYWPLRNLFAHRQLMNASFNRYHLVNAYGAFGTVSRHRFEVIVEGNAAEKPAADGWREYEFRGKPGDVKRMPRQFAPYHLRLDWLMWFLALGTPDTRWFEMLVVALLAGDRRLLRMLRVNPFPGEPPQWIRARVYLYRFSTRAERRAEGIWWSRVEVGEIVAPVSLARIGRGEG